MNLKNFGRSPFNGRILLLFPSLGLILKSLLAVVEEGSLAVEAGIVGL